MKTRKDIVKTASDVEAVVEKLIRECVEKAIGKDVPTSAFVYNSETRLLAHTLDIRRHYEGISGFVYYEKVELAYKDLTFVLLLPPIIENGQEVPYYITSVQDLVGYAARSGIRFPFPRDDKSGIRFASRYSHSVCCEDEKARFTDPKRVVSCIQSFLKYTGHDPIDQSVTNPLLAAIAEAHAEEAYHCEFIGDGVSISDVYSNEVKNALRYVSCMAGAPASYFELYDSLQEDGSLTMIRLKNGRGEFKGRALCWIGSNPDDYYLDRLYVPVANGVQIPDCVGAFQRFCNENGINKAVYSRTAASIGLELKNISIELPHEIGYYDSYPYVDSMYRAYSDGRLRNHSNVSDSYVVAELQHTDGTAQFDDDDEYVLLENGDRCSLEEAVEVDGRWYHIDDCTRTVNDDYCLTCECEKLNPLYYNRYDYAHQDEVVETYDECIILTGDSVTLYDGRIAHSSEVRTLEDNSGGYALCDECEELPDGRWVLASDVAKFLAEAEAEAELIPA